MTKQIDKFDNKWYGAKKVRTYLDDFDESKKLMSSRTLADSLGLESFIPLDAKSVNDIRNLYIDLTRINKEICKMHNYLLGQGDYTCKIYEENVKRKKRFRKKIANDFKDKCNEYLPHFKQSVEQVRERTMEDKADSPHWRRERRELLQLLCENVSEWPLHLDKGTRNYVLVEEFPEKRRDSNHLIKTFAKDLTSNLSSKDTSVLKSVILPAVFEYNKQFCWLRDHRKWFDKERGMELATDVFNPLNYMSLADVLPSRAISSKFVKIVHPDESLSNAKRSRGYHLQVDFNELFNMDGLNEFTYELSNNL